MRKFHCFQMPCPSFRGVFLLVLFLSTFGLLPAVAQCVFNGNLTFSNQQEVDDFKTNYPDCTVIEGEVTVHFSTVSNLNGLSNIEVIRGGLWLAGNLWLWNLDGLQALDTVGHLRIGGNQQMYSISGLSGLKVVTDYASIDGNEQLGSLTGLENLQYVGGDFTLEWLGMVPDLAPLANLSHIGGSLFLNYMPVPSLASLDNLQTIGGSLTIRNCNSLTSLDGLQQLDSLPGSLIVAENFSLDNLSALNGVKYVGQDCIIEQCNALTSLAGLESLSRVGATLRLKDLPLLNSLAPLSALDSVGYSLEVRGTGQVTDLQGLEGITQVPGQLYITGNSALSSLTGLGNLNRVGSDCVFSGNPSLTDLTALANLRQVAALDISNNAQLASLAGLQGLDTVGAYLFIGLNAVLPNLNGLDNLTYVAGWAQIFDNPSLTSLAGLDNLMTVASALDIINNPLLADCAAQAVCRQLFFAPQSITISGNAPGCSGTSEVTGQCQTAPVAVQVLLDANGDCVADAGALPAPDIRVRMEGGVQLELKPTAANGRALFQYLDPSVVTLSLPQFPTADWAVCQNGGVVIDPDTVNAGDTLRATFLLKPLQACPALEVRLGLPASFQECPSASEVWVFTQNQGTVSAQGTQTAVVMPPGFEVLDANPAPVGQLGDTLLFNLGDLPPWASSNIRLAVRPPCGAYQIGQAFCWSAFATQQNACAAPPPSASQIKISADCLGDSVRFTLQNIGTASTQNLHTYRLIRGKYIQRTDTFALAAQAVLTVTVPANGHTWRLEATRADDGSRTALSKEGCGGLKPGLVTAFWQDHGPMAADYDCRQVLGAPQPIAYSAFPSGVGPTQLLPANQPITYTIAFQNGSGDTVRHILIKNQFSADLDLNTLRPLAASHPFAWHVRSGNVLEVRFDPIALPDSLVNLAASRGYFTFSVAQKPNLPAGTTLTNNASVEFDQQPASIFGGGYHLVGEPFPQGVACMPGGNYVYSQSQVDAFPYTFPGCTVIEGAIQIYGSDITNFKGYEEVSSIGHLIIQSSYNLTDLNGLTSLEHLGGLFLEGNQALENLHGLESLHTVGTNGVTIFNNPNFASLSGLESLHTIAGNLGLSLDAPLSGLQGLSGLSEIDGDFGLGVGQFAASNVTDLHGLEHLDKVGGALNITNTYLTSLDGLSGLDSVGHLQVQHNALLENMLALLQLRDIGGELQIVDNNLWSLSGLDGVQRVGGSVSINGNGNLSDLAGLQGLAHIGGSLNIESNPVLLYLQAPYGLTHVPGDVYINNNPFLQSLDGLNNLQRVEGDFAVTHSLLSDGFSDLGGLRHVGGQFTLDDCADLTTLNALHLLDTVGGSFVMLNLPKMTLLNGLENLHYIGQNLFLGNMPLLANLTELGNLDYVGADLNIIEDDALTNLQGLDRLQGVGGEFLIWNNDALIDLTGLSELDSVGGNFTIRDNLSLTNLAGLPQLDSIGGNVHIKDNTALVDLSGLGNVTALNHNLRVEGNAALTSLTGLDKVKTIAEDLYLDGNPALTDLGMNALRTVGYSLFAQANPLLSFGGTGSLDTVRGDFFIWYNGAKSFTGLGGLRYIGGNFDIEYNFDLKNFSGLSNLHRVENSVYIVYYNGLENMAGLEGLTEVGLDFQLHDCGVLHNLKGLDNLSIIGRELVIHHNYNLFNLDGLGKLGSVEFLHFYENPNLSNLHGLEGMTEVEGTLVIRQNPKLLSLGGLQNLGSIGALPNSALEISYNPSLPDCAVIAVCDHLATHPDRTYIQNNAPGCNSTTEVEGQCHSVPVLVTVLLDSNTNCQPDLTDTPLAEAHVKLNGQTQMSLRPADASGQVLFRYFEQGPLSLHLPQFPTANWAACESDIMLDPAGLPDTLRATFVLQPLNPCPELSVQLDMPSFFRGCFVQSDLRVLTENTGTMPAENAQLAVVMPPVFELVSASTPVVAQNGDTLLFALGNLQPFQKSAVLLTVKTRCDTFLFGQTLCWEAFAGMDNACPDGGSAASEIKLSATCAGDTAVVFTLKNIGNMPTQAPHTYRLFRNEGPWAAKPFALNPQESLVVSVPADGATYRMEATKWEDGTLTAIARENCGGLTPGYITAFWLDDGPAAYAFDCRTVNGAFDPNLKTASPTGSGPQHYLSANRPLEYTIDFQNTGTDTAYQVLLRDPLPVGLDINTFKPGLSSHPCTWEIREGKLLEVLFSPIMLPDSNVNEPASHGYFSFTIDQLPDLPTGTYLDNSASIIFDYNPPIITNTVHHAIGQLTVKVDEAAQHPLWWQVLGNPTRTTATFRALEFIGGEKQFEMYDGLGQRVRSVRFDGQEWTLERNGLASGVYIFTIRDVLGRVFSGRVVVVD